MRCGQKTEGMAQGMMWEIKGGREGIASLANAALRYPNIHCHPIIHCHPSHTQRKFKSLAQCLLDVTTVRSAACSPEAQSQRRQTVPSAKHALNPCFRSNPASPSSTTGTPTATNLHNCKPHLSAQSLRGAQSCLKPIRWQSSSSCWALT